MGKYIITTENVNRDFPIAGREPVKVLKQVSVEIPEKSLTILRGPSGSGKTTLMNIIGALDTPTAGKVFFDGQEISAMSDTGREKLRRKNVGFVFQSVSLIPMMTVYENVEPVGVPRGPHTQHVTIAKISENAKPATTTMIDVKNSLYPPT